MRDKQHIQTLDRAGNPPLYLSLALPGHLKREKKMKHTQGQWLQNQVLANDCPGKVTLIHTDYKDGHLGVATVNWTEEEEGQANANLIASAPELLKLAKMERDKHLFGEAEFFLKYGVNWNDIKGIRNELIAKAGGK